MERDSSGNKYKGRANTYAGGPLAKIDQAAKGRPRRLDADT